MHRLVKIVFLRLIMRGHRLVKVVAVQAYVKVAWLRHHEHKVERKIAGHVREMERDEMAARLLEIDLC